MSSPPDMNGKVFYFTVRTDLERARIARTSFYEISRDLISKRLRAESGLSLSGSLKEETKSIEFLYTRSQMFWSGTQRRLLLLMESFTPRYFLYSRM